MARAKVLVLVHWLVPVLDQLLAKFMVRVRVGAKERPQIRHFTRRRAKQINLLLMLLLSNVH
jgi:hypothetical protein